MPSDLSTSENKRCSDIGVAASLILETGLLSGIGSDIFTVEYVRQLHGGPVETACCNSRVASPTLGARVAK